MTISPGKQGKDREVARSQPVSRSKIKDSVVDYAIVFLDSEKLMKLASAFPYSFLRS